MLSEQVTKDMSGGSMIRKMFEEGTRLKALYGAENVYDFSLGNPDLDPPEAFKASLRQAIDYPNVHKYMSNAGYPDVRDAIAQREGKRAGIELPGSHIIMTVGAAGALNVALKSLLNPGDEVIVLAPYFVEYLYYIKNYAGVPIIVPVNSDTFQPDAQTIAAALTPKTKAIILNTPNNPSGAVYSGETLNEIADVLKSAEQKYKTQIYVLSDEPYAALCYDGIKPPSLLNHFSNAIIGNSYSKSLCLPGERIGYLAVHPDAADAEQLLAALTFSLRTLGFVNAPSLMQRALLGALDATVDVDRYQKRRNLFHGILTEAGFSCMLPQGAFYLFPKVPIEAAAFADLAAQENILCVPGDGFGWPGHVRLAYCVDEGTIERSRSAWLRLRDRLG